MSVEQEIEEPTAELLALRAARANPGTAVNSTIVHRTMTEYEIDSTRPVQSLTIHRTEQGLSDTTHIDISFAGGEQSRDSIRAAAQRAGLEVQTSGNAAFSIRGPNGTSLTQDQVNRFTYTLSEGDKPLLAPADAKIILEHEAQRTGVRFDPTAVERPVPAAERAAPAAEIKPEPVPAPAQATKPEPVTVAATPSETAAAHPPTTYERTPSTVFVPTKPNGDVTVSFLDVHLNPQDSPRISAMRENGTLAALADGTPAMQINTTLTVSSEAEARAISSQLAGANITSRVSTNPASVDLKTPLSPAQRDAMMTTFQENGITARINAAGAKIEYSGATPDKMEALLPNKIARSNPAEAYVIAQAPAGQVAHALPTEIDSNIIRETTRQAELAHPNQMAINRDIETEAARRLNPPPKPTKLETPEGLPTTNTALPGREPNGRPVTPATSVANANERGAAAEVQTLRTGAAAPAAATAAEQEAARIARLGGTAARTGTSAARAGGHGVLGMAVVGVVTAGAVLAGGGGVAHAAEAGGTAMAEGALPGVTTGFDNLHQGNFVDRMLNGANTVTAGVASGATLVAAGAGAATLTGIAAPVAAPTAAVATVVTAGATAANLAVGVVHDITYLAGMSEQGGLILGPSDKPFVETTAMVDAKTALAADKVNQDLINSPASARAAELMDSKTPLPDPKMEAMRQQLLQAERDIPNASPIGEMGQPFSPRQNAQLAYNSQLANFIHAVNGDAPPAPTVAPAPAPGEPAAEAVASTAPQPGTQQPTASAAPPLPPGVTPEQAAAARAAFSNTTVTGGISRDEAPAHKWRRRISRNGNSKVAAHSSSATLTVS